MKPGFIRYHLWKLLAHAFGLVEWVCGNIYYWVQERMFRIEREWDY